MLNRVFNDYQFACEIEVERQIICGKLKKQRDECDHHTYYDGIMMTFQLQCCKTYNYGIMHILRYGDSIYCVIVLRMTLLVK